MALNLAPYPPIVDNWLTPAVMGDDITIYFSLSAYANLVDIRTDIILIDIFDSENNESVIDYISNSNINQLTAPLQTDDEGRFFVKVSTKFVKVQVDHVYKVQLRFCSSSISASAADIQKNPTDDKWSAFISDYSTVSLLKIITRPVLELQEFLNVDAKANYIISAPVLSLVGQLTFGQDSDESLSSYWIEIYENLTGPADDTDTVILKTDVLYPDTRELNTISFLVKKDLKNNAYYFMRVTYETSSGFIGKNEYNFLVQYNDYVVTNSPPLIVTSLNQEKGAVIVKITGGEDYQGYCVLRRTDNTTNFTEWDELKYLYKDTLDSDFNIVVEDYLVQAGRIYCYQVLPLAENGQRKLWAIGGEENAE